MYLIGSQTLLFSPLLQESPIILRDGNGTIYPMAKDCMGGLRDPDWLDLPPISSLGMGVHSLINLPANSTIKKKAAIIIMAVEVIWFFKLIGLSIEKTLLESRETVFNRLFIAPSLQELRVY